MTWSWFLFLNTCDDFKNFFSFSPSTGWFKTHKKIKQTNEKTWMLTSIESATLFLWDSFQQCSAYWSCSAFPFPACSLTPCDTEISTSRTTFFQTQRLKVLPSLLLLFKMSSLHQPDLLFSRIKSSFPPALFPSISISRALSALLSSER